MEKYVSRFIDYWKEVASASLKRMALNGFVRRKDRENEKYNLELNQEFIDYVLAKN